MARRKARKQPSVSAWQDEHEAIALRIHQIAAAAAVMAESQDEPLSHALYLIEQSLLDVEERIQRLSGAGPARAVTRSALPDDARNQRRSS